MTDDRSSAECLADIAGLGQNPKREAWITACIAVLLNARKEEREAMIGDMPEPIRRHAMDTLALVAQSIRAAYCWGLANRESWQPIETAPRDGTMILVGRWDKGVATVYSDHWAEDPGCWCDSSGSFQPTDWMHVPHPPAGRGVA